MQIRSRLTLQFILTVATILLLTLGFVYIRFRQSMEVAFYNGLRFKATTIARMVLLQGATLDTLPVGEEAVQFDKNMPVDHLVAIFDMERNRVFSLNAPAEKLAESTYQMTGQLGECRLLYGGLPGIAMRTASPSGRPYIVVAASAFQTEELDELLRILVAGFFLSIGMVALVGYLFARKALEPVSAIVNEVDAIRPADLSARLREPRNADEIARLINTFNRMLDRIEVAFQMQKRFVSNISHELKNPISVIVSQLEVALNRDRSPEAYRQTLQSVLQDSHGLADMTEKLLQIARAYSDENRIEHTPLRLDELVLQVQSGLDRSKPHYHIAFNISGPLEEEAQLLVNGNEALLRLALTNLIDNGCKFSPDHRVAVTLLVGPGQKPVLDISDNGPGIPPDDLPFIFQPFYRGVQQAKTAGSGIGLSLVDSILRLHQVTLDVQSVVGQGTRIRLAFP
ncbi:MAG: ATP-binding protein [Saprospiraceae bacterium]|nr:ATP-binding protein [Saprospiraceae bacterium]